MCDYKIHLNSQITYENKVHRYELLLMAKRSDRVYEALLPGAL